MARILISLAGVLALGACGGSGPGADDYARQEKAEAYSIASAPSAAPMPAMEQSFDGGGPQQVILPPAPPPPPPGPDGQTNIPPGQAPLMAYTYQWQFSVPTENMQKLQAAHQKLCADAGPANCYVTNSSLNAIGKAEGASGYLSLRAKETWVRSFEAGVGDGLRPFGGSVYSSTRDSDELTTQIVDNEARLKSMVAHRDALQAMIDKKPGKLSDLLEIEQSLAQAQGDIDSRQSLLAALRLRVSMSVVTFNYQPEYAAISNSVWRPIGDAFGDFGPAFARTIAAIISFVAEVLPVVILLGLAGLGGWLFMRRRARRKGTVEPVKSVQPTVPGGT